MSYRFCWIVINLTTLWTTQLLLDIKDVHYLLGGGRVTVRRCWLQLTSWCYTTPHNILCSLLFKRIWSSQVLKTKFLIFSYVIFDVLIKHLVLAILLGKYSFLKLFTNIVHKKCNSSPLRFLQTSPSVPVTHIQ